MQKRRAEMWAEEAEATGTLGQSGRFSHRIDRIHMAQTERSEPKRLRLREARKAWQEAVQGWRKCPDEFAEVCNSAYTELCSALQAMSEAHEVAHRQALQFIASFLSS